jgi:hypothetical protein
MAPLSPRNSDNTRRRAGQAAAPARLTVPSADRKSATVSFFQFLFEKLSETVLALPLCLHDLVAIHAGPDLPPGAVTGSPPLFDPVRELFVGAGILQVLQLRLVSFAKSLRCIHRHPPFLCTAARRGHHRSWRGVTRLPLRAGAQNPLALGVPDSLLLGMRPAFKWSLWTCLLPTARSFGGPRFGGLASVAPRCFRESCPGA